ncbi:hypothetical protein AU198_22985 [Mycobacterium sp. GA-1199]|uniref:SLC13 family permease n=1 Tax=Mycobacterium sp. GA-1199 TaxID=1772287 RepID=UPI00074ADAC3|nr:SLC13 family permease [Mycobacterium sp. GA-1199]KUI45729.1 hypothetical protein AU198_22985 [Mycobacterium sp. GA-1199]
MSDAALSLVIVGIAVALFIWNRLPVEVVAIGVALTLYFTGLIDTRTLFSGFGDAVIVFIASLFVVSEGLEASGVTAWGSGTLARLAGRVYARLVTTVLALGAVVSAIITVNGAAAALVPVTTAVVRRARIPPSKALIPLAFGCSAGVAAFAEDAGCSIERVVTQPDADLLGRDSGLAELVIPPRSNWLGVKAFPGMSVAGVTVLSVHRMYADLGARVVEFSQGDPILVRGQWSAIDRLTASGMLVVDSTEDVRRQTVALDRPSPRALVVLAAMVGLLVTGIVPPAVAALLAALAMVALRVVRTDLVYRAIPWQTIILIGALIPLSTAVQTSGAAEQLATPIVDAVGNHCPYLLLSLLFVLTALLGQFISNVATVLVVIPIAVAAAVDSGVSVQATLILVALAGAASLLTPIATPANMIVMHPGGCRFSDYWRLGIVTMVAWFTVAMVVIPLWWPLG